jgi:hypothetical protein
MTIYRILDSHFVCVRGGIAGDLNIRFGFIPKEMGNWIANEDNVFTPHIRGSL